MGLHIQSCAIWHGQQRSRHGKTKPRIFCMVNYIIDYDLTTQEPNELGLMILTSIYPGFFASAPDELVVQFTVLYSVLKGPVGNVATLVITQWLEADQAGHYQSQRCASPPMHICVLVCQMQVSKAGQVITPHRHCEMQLLDSAFDACFWKISPHITVSSSHCFQSASSGHLYFWYLNNNNTSVLTFLDNAFRTPSIKIINLHWENNLR